MADSKNNNHLEEDRTRMANQRTILAYIRTSLGVLVLAILIFKFAPTVIGIPLGAVTLVVSLIIFLYGFKSYRKMEHRINGN